MITRDNYDFVLALIHKSPESRLDPLVARWVDDMVVGVSRAEVSCGTVRNFINTLYRDYAGLIGQYGRNLIRGLHERD